MWDDRTIRGHKKKLKRTIHARDKKKYIFPYRSIETWNKLDVGVINARNINDFKDKLDNNRFGDGMVRS